MPAKTSIHAQPYNALDNRLYDLPDFPAQAIGGCVSSLLLRIVKGKLTQDEHIAQRDLYARCILSIYKGAESSTAIAVDKVYRLFDSSINGTDYALTVEGKAPAVPVLPPNIPIENDVRGLLLNIYNTLAANEGGQLDDEMLAELSKIALLLV